MRLTAKSNIYISDKEADHMSSTSHGFIAGLKDIS